MVVVVQRAAAVLTFGLPKRRIDELGLGVRQLEVALDTHVEVDFPVWNSDWDHRGHCQLSVQRAAASYVLRVRN